MWLPEIFLLFVLLAFVHAGNDLSRGDDLDLTRFVTRPDIKAPLFRVTTNDLNRVTPGHWFIAPYQNVLQEKQPQGYYQACQTGPAIYDKFGDLIWSGACQVQNQNTFDFRAIQINGSQHLTILRSKWEGTDIDERGRGTILDSSYRELQHVEPPRNKLPMDMHEFNVIDNGRRALFVSSHPEIAGLSDLQNQNRTFMPMGWVVNQGFVEVDLASGEELFEWNCLPHVPLGASSRPIVGLENRGWNYFHLNSIEKAPSGDYLISSRYTDAIYLISHLDGSVLWRLGGVQSSFELEGFNFSKQHDPRVISQNSTHFVFSFLDNASDGKLRSADLSTAYVIALETRNNTMTARVLNKWQRPGSRVSGARGNVQILPNGNAFVGWSDHGHLSEHTPDGDKLLDAEFYSNRTVTYRAYKFNFTGQPIEAPIVRSFVYSGGPGAQEVTVAYVSWNGATEVDSWRFHGSSRKGDEVSAMGVTSRIGFETVHQASGAYHYVTAEALDKDGAILGSSVLTRSVVPGGWTVQDAERKQRESELAAQMAVPTTPTLVAWNRALATMPEMKPSRLEEVSANVPLRLENEGGARDNYHTEL